MSKQFNIDEDLLAEIYTKQALKNRTIHFIEEFTRESCYKAIYFMERIERLDDLENLPKKERIINIVFASYGGCVYSCLALISTIERLKEKGYTINSHIQSMAMSAAFFTSIVCSHRTMNRYAYMMIHQLSSGAIGSMTDMEVEVEHSRELNDRLFEIVTKNTSYTKEDLHNIKIYNQDCYLSAETALCLNCIDEII